MGTAELSKLLNKTIQLHDTRSDCFYNAQIADVKNEWGKTRIKLQGCSTWFEPTAKEMETVK